MSTKRQSHPAAPLRGNQIEKALLAKGFIKGERKTLTFVRRVVHVPVMDPEMREITVENFLDGNDHAYIEERVETVELRTKAEFPPELR